MLYLVEGLNGAGKTSWIKQSMKRQIETKHSIWITTPWLNPLRWDDQKKQYFDGEDATTRKTQLGSYLLGSYEALLQTLAIKAQVANDIFIDRSFISAYVYGPMLPWTFEAIKEYCCELFPNFEVIFIDTKPETCISRIANIRAFDPQYKSYADDNINLDNLKRHRAKMLSTILTFPRYRIIREA